MANPRKTEDGLAVASLILTMQDMMRVEYMPLCDPSARLRHSNRLRSLCRLSRSLFPSPSPLTPLPLWTFPIVDFPHFFVPFCSRATTRPYMCVFATSDDRGRSGAGHSPSVPLCTRRASAERPGHPPAALEATSCVCVCVTGAKEGV